MVFGDINKLHALKQSLQMTSVALPLPVLIFPAAGARALLSCCVGKQTERTFVSRFSVSLSARHTATQRRQTYSAVRSPLEELPPLTDVPAMSLIVVPGCVHAAGAGQDVRLRGGHHL